MKNPYQVIKDFEAAMCEYTGAPYAVAVESCSAALFLCCKFAQVLLLPEVFVPRITYPSVPAGIVNAGGRVRFFDDPEWQSRGYYRLFPTDIYDSAKYLARNMYVDIDNGMVCLSFHAKKAIPIGRGGMILTDDSAAASWLRLARFDGRHEAALHTDEIAMIGWNMYMEPEQAARGLQLMQWLPDKVLLPPDPYQDLSKYDFYTKANR